MRPVGIAIRMEREDSSELVRLEGGIPFAGEGQPRCALLLEDATGVSRLAVMGTERRLSSRRHGLQGCGGVDGGHWAGDVCMKVAVAP